MRFLVACALVLGCRSGAPVGPSGAGRVRAFSESSTVVDLAQGGDLLWVATSRGLLRWDLRAGGFDRIGRGNGLAADHATAVAIDVKGIVWVATENGLARKPTPTGKWEMWATPEIGDRVRVLVTTATPPTLWAGGPGGAARMAGAGRWQVVVKKEDVTAILPDADGSGAWIGTREHGAVRTRNDKAAAFGPGEGNHVTEVRGIARTDDGGVLFAGVNGGHAMLAYHDGNRMFSYRLDPDGDVRFLRRVGGRILLGLGTQVWALRRVPEDMLPSGKLTSQPILPATPKGEKPPRPPVFDGKTVDIGAPADLTATFASQNDLWMGTRSLGVGRWGGVGITWYSTHDLTDGAERLTVACASPDECYLATGGPHAWWFDGRGFQEAEIDNEPGSRVLAILRDQRGNVVAIHRGARGRSLRLSRVNQGVWSPVAMQEIEVPEGQPELTFAAYAPSGHLWLGLQYHDRSGEPRFHGAAEVDVDTGRTQYHRQYPAGTSPPPGTLPIPNDCTAVYFAPDAIWFATKSGAARVDAGPAGTAAAGGGTKVHIYTENDGLESELLRDVDGGSKPGEVVVATDRGVGFFDGRHWRFSKQGPLSWRARALARDPSDLLWVATDHGAVAVRNGVPIATWDQHSGLLEDDARDIWVDLAGRVWVLGARSVAIIDAPRQP